MAKRINYIVTGVGIKCTRCGLPTEERAHKSISDKILKQPFYYSKWFRCLNPNCKTTQIVLSEYIVMKGQDNSEIVRQNEFMEYLTD